MPSKYGDNTQARVVRLVRGHRDYYESDWTAVKAMAGRLG